MNKALHVLVYLFLVLAGAGLFFEIQLNAKRALLTDRNRMQEDFYIRIAKTIEKVEADKAPVLELKKDSDPVEAKIIDIPNTDNVLEDYNNTLETANLDTFEWNNDQSKAQLRMVYVLDAEGKVVMDGNRPKDDGPGTEREMLTTLFEAAKGQQTRLNTTRAELVSLRGKLESAIEEINRLKPLMRQDRVTIEEKKDEIDKLEETKAALENEIVRLKSHIEELNTEITSLKDQVVNAQNENENLKEEIAKRDKIIESQKKIIRDSIQNRAVKAGAGTAVASIPAGDKGTIVQADNTNMFAVVKFTDEALNELRGGNKDAPLPALELGIKRPGFNGPAGEFVGRIKLRQEVKGKPYVICDILGSWEQDKIQVDDTVFSD